MSWSSLPEDLWKVILGNISVPQRLGVCSRVSKKLYGAAAAATEQLQLLELRAFTPSRIAGVDRWLQINGQHVTSLQSSWRTDTAAWTQLPCKNLSQLDIEDSRVQLAVGSNQFGILYHCNGLTKLKMTSCTLDEGPDSLTALTAVTALQHLQLSDNCTVDMESLNLQGRILQALTLLTALILGVEVTAESLKHISALQHLQQLRLDCASVPLSLSSTPGLAQLTGLHTVILERLTLNPAVLQHHTALQCLQVNNCKMSGANSGAVMLAVLGQQLQLQQLKLLGLECGWPTAAADFTTLTASSRLQKLVLVSNGLPAGVWQAVFCHRKWLPCLQSLITCRYDFSVDDGDPPAGFCSSTDISMLLKCCPGLRRLNIDLQPGVQLAALSQLTDLTSLTLERANGASVKSLSGLLRLKDLEICGDPPFSQADVVHLTALQQLTSLQVDPPDEGMDVDEDGFDTYVRFINKNQDDNPAPDV